MSSTLDIICLENSRVLLRPLLGTVVSPSRHVAAEVPGDKSSVTNAHTGTASTSRTSWSVAVTGITSAETGEREIHRNGAFFWTEILHNLQE